ncbi:MAG: c-type cytochrome [Gammaproteobacteria bacterium]|nr:c-type cytochrome [Gammaproteobacteria bacterium]MYL14342.1 c-type cytochrome [Gammaproteobacteria bacterium]
MSHTKERQGLNRIAGFLVVFAAFYLPGVWQGAAAQGVNPYAGQPRAVLAGGALFRAQCATCHGADGKGILSIDAPDLSLMWAREGVNDEYVFNVVRDGVPGSIMPPHGLSETELWMLVSFMASLSEGGRDAEFVGDAGNGRRLFADNCAECHRAGAEAGGVLGPALTGVTRRRSPEALMQSIREPSERIERGFRPVTVETDAESVTGVLKNEDAFSLQLVTEAQSLRAFRRDGVRQLNRLGASLMPVFSEAELDAGELADLLAFLHGNQ